MSPCVIALKYISEIPCSQISRRIMRNLRGIGNGIYIVRSAYITCVTADAVISKKHRPVCSVAIQTLTCSKTGDIRRTLPHGRTILGVMHCMAVAADDHPGLGSVNLNYFEQTY
jgi:hypothetical protein